ncbi:cytochrome c oxidase subunit II [Roseiconus nitratireducens]|uniref:cytochrome-c oxidase n=1 Tax=Roseiconus nitratireducens TaxID=2605748 RepID=A0A5M6D2R7_9BACT|nr:cytochrome c oxidase subunit II [Roseiconus nitratireducens]KAA5541807.1 cytochrome c oxidase subunit II [Roseiconus nitratireducens]
MNESFSFFPESASEGALQFDRLSLALFGVCVLFSLGISLAILVFIARYWHSREVDRQFQPSRGMHWLVEITWMLGPLAILLGLFAWGAVVYIRAHRPPTDPVEVNVVAKQWMWKIAHPSGRREINTLHLPIGRPVRLTMISEDVIHSFFVPAFRVKQDVLPGRYSTLWFRATKPGRYHLFCAEYCGTEHSQMIGQVVVQQREEYAEWIAQGTEESLAQAGRRNLDSMGCLQCHGGIPGGQVGPPLTGLYGHRVTLSDGARVVADPEYLRRSILEPAAEVREGFEPKMPSYDGQIDPEQLLEIIAYLRSVADATGPLAGPGTLDTDSRSPGASSPVQQSPDESSPPGPTGEDDVEQPLDSPEAAESRSPPSTDAEESR